MPNVDRIDDGAPIRDAMRTAELSGPRLSAATKALDETGRGISPAGVAKVAAAKSKVRPRPRTARLIADALGVPAETLFVIPTDSTVTVERATPHGRTDAR